MKGNLTMNKLIYLLLNFIGMLINTVIAYIDGFSKKKKYKYFVKYTKLFSPIMNMVIFLIINPKQ